MYDSRGGEGEYRPSKIKGRMVTKMKAGMYKPFRFGSQMRKMMRI